MQTIRNALLYEIVAKENETFNDMVTQFMSQFMATSNVNTVSDEMKMLQDATFLKIRDSQASPLVELVYNVEVVYFVLLDMGWFKNGSNLWRRKHCVGSTVSTSQSPCLVTVLDDNECVKSLNNEAIHVDESEANEQSEANEHKASTKRIASLWSSEFSVELHDTIEKTCRDRVLGATFGRFLDSYSLWYHRNENAKLLNVRPPKESIKVVLHLP